MTTTYADSVTRNGRTRAILADLVARAADADAPPERLAKRIAVYRAERYGAHADAISGGDDDALARIFGPATTEGDDNDRQV